MSKHVGIHAQLRCRNFKILSAAPMIDFCFDFDIKGNVMPVTFTSGTSVHLGRRQNSREILFEPSGQHNQVRDAVKFFWGPPQSGMDYDRRTVIHHFECDCQVLGEAGVTVMLANANTGLRVHPKPCNFKFLTLFDQEIVKGVFRC